LKLFEEFATSESPEASAVESLINSAESLIESAQLLTCCKCNQNVMIGNRTLVNLIVFITSIKVAKKLSLLTLGCGLDDCGHNGQQDAKTQLKCKSEKKKQRKVTSA
jgi:hypothetical protein